MPIGSPTNEELEYALDQAMLDDENVSLEDYNNFMNSPAMVRGHLPQPRKPNSMKNKWLNEYNLSQIYGDYVGLQDWEDDIGLSNPYTKGMNFRIAPEHMDDYLAEYKRLSQPDNYDSLLMYILQKNAQSGFKNGPIGSDGYYEAFDPEYNEDLYPDFNNFINTYYLK